MSLRVAIELPDSLPESINGSPATMAAELRLAAAVKWYEAEMLSQGKAAEVAGLSRAEFIDALARFRVSPFQITAEEIARESRA